MAYHKLAVRALLLVVCLAALASGAQAQYRASIQGVVTDPSGATVGGVYLAKEPASGWAHAKLTTMMSRPKLAPGS